jgi:hypothetical protein
VVRFHRSAVRYGAQLGVGDHVTYDIGRDENGPVATSITISVFYRATDSFRRERQMKSTKIFLTLSIILALFAGCAGVDATLHFPSEKAVKAKHRPPPHAPAHGHRHKHRHGTELEFDTGIGAYVVANVTGTYFFNDLYIRLASDGRWTVAAHLNSSWRVALKGEVPHKLKEKKGKKHPGKGKKEKKKKR